MLRFLLTFSMTLAFSSACVHARTPPEAEVPEHLLRARNLISRLDLKNTSYEHKFSKVVFEGEAQSHTDCSGFLLALLSKSYGLSEGDVLSWLNHSRPLASDFHNAIESLRGFRVVERISQIEPGDILAIRYSIRKEGNTGHVLLASVRPFPLLNKGEWGLTVIDSSHTGHGTTDTRYAKGKNGKDHDGLGEGVFRLFEDSEGKVRGFSWSIREDSIYRLPRDEHLLIGRITLPLNIHPSSSIPESQLDSGIHAITH